MDLLVRKKGNVVKMWPFLFKNGYNKLVLYSKINHILALWIDKIGTMTKNDLTKEIAAKTVLEKIEVVG